jgi:predicted PurR-regulated permease PerM
MPTQLRQRLPETILALLALAAALHYAQAVAAPLALAVVTAMVLSPVHRLIARPLGGNSALAAALTLVLSVAALGTLAALLRPWVIDAITAWPQMRQELRALLNELRLSLAGLLDIQRDMIEAIDPEGASTSGSSENAMPSIADAAWLAPRILAQGFIFFGGIFFFLLGRDHVYEKLALRLGNDGPGSTADDFHKAEALVARYFGAVGMINIGFGIIVALALSFAGLPGAPVWGAIAAAANFVIYLGPAITAAALIFAGTVAFDGIAAFLPAALFVSINAVEGQFVTPMIVGRHLRLNPLLVFVSLTFWLWLWGPIGGIVAIPILLWITALWPSPVPTLLGAQD